MLVQPSAPAVQLIQAQIDWIDDWSPFKFSLKSRQIGFTWAETLGIAQYLAFVPGGTWFYLTLNEQRAAEAIGYVVQHCQAMGIALTQANLDIGFFEETKYRQLSLTLPNGSKIIGLPANPTTARGVNGNVTLDEFAHQIHAAQIYTALAPAAATWGWALHIITTPNGRQGEAYEIWTDSGRVQPEAIAAELQSGRQPIADDWSRHWCDIYTAKLQGHPVDIERCRRIARTEVRFRQEYCCEFVDDALAWLPFKLLEQCTRGEASLYFDSTVPPAGYLYAGYDVGRRRNLASIWLNELRNKAFCTRGVITMDNTPFREQKRRADDVMRFCRRMGVDGIGIGAQLAEDLAEDHGSSAVYAVPSRERAACATKMRTLAERGLLWIPDDADVRSDFNSVRRVLTDKGNESFQAPSRGDGHADRFWSCAFSVHAAGGEGSTDAEPVGGTSRYGDDRVGSRGWRDTGY